MAYYAVGAQRDQGRHVRHQPRVLLRQGPGDNSSKHQAGVNHLEKRTGATAEAWCLLIHADAYLSLTLSLQLEKRGLADVL
jgi:hypothetical protein